MKKKHFNAKILVANTVLGRLSKFCMLLIVLMMGTVELSASAESQDSEISLTVRDKTLASIFSMITKQTGFKVFYNTTQLDTSRKVSVDITNRPVREVLQQLLEGTAYTYEVYKKQIVIVAVKPDSAKKKSKPRVIRGVVKDENGESLPGVSVVLKGTDLGVATDIEGKYVFEIPKSKGTLLFSFVGMLPQEVVLGISDKINVVLEENNEMLDEVVVTGYQKLNVNQAAGSFNTVDMKSFERKISPDVSSVLEGLSPSLVISSDPSSSKKELTIRGVSTLQGSSSPLIIVDGFPYDDNLSSINPYEIESITLLKDAASASIYGAKSANGVIVITTKRGERGNLEIRYMNTIEFSGKPDIDYVMNRVSSSDLVDIQAEFYRKNKDKLNSYQYYFEKSDPYSEYYMGTRNRVLNLYISQKEGRISQSELDKQLDQLRRTDNTEDLKKLLLQTPFISSHNLSANLGGERFRLRTSLNYFNEKKGFKGSKAYGILYNLNSIIDISERFKLDLSATFDLDRGEKYLDNPSSFFNLDSYESLYDENGNPVIAIKPYRDLGTNSKGLYGGKDDYLIQRLIKLGMLDETYYPASDYGLSKSKSNNWGARFQAQMGVRIFKGLDAKVAFNIRKKAVFERDIKDKNSWEMRSWINNLTSKTKDGKKGKLNIPLGSRIKERRFDNTSYLLRGQLDYNKKINSHHELIALIGSEVQSIKRTGTMVDRVGYDDRSNTYKEINYLDLAKDISDVFQPGGGNIPGGLGLANSFFEKEDRYFSAYANANYLYSDKYVVSASWRIDQSNLFGTDPKYRFKPFWSVGTKWRIAEEKFFTSSLFSKLDLQFSYGVNGNISNNYGPYDIAVSQFIYRAGQARGLVLDSYAVADLRWETTKTFNVGIHSRMFRDRVSWSLDYYRKHTNDVLAESESDPTLGSNYIMRNDASITNDGVETALSTKNIKTNNFEWNTYFNLNYNKSRVEKIYEKDVAAYYIAGRVENRLGYEPKSLFVFDWAGVNDKGHGQVKRNNGDIVAISPSIHDGGKFNPLDLKRIDLKHAGTTLPKVVMGLTNNFIYKNFSLSFMFVYQGGHVMLRDSYNGQSIGSRSSLVNREAAMAWTKPGDENKTNVPALNSAYYYSIASSSTKNIIDGDFIRLRDIVFSYTFPSTALEKIGFKEITINLRGKNLWLWTKNSYDIDPETQGLGNRNFPVSKSISAGFNITF